MSRSRRSRREVSGFEGARVGDTSLTVEGTGEPLRFFLHVCRKLTNYRPKIRLLPQGAGTVLCPFYRAPLVVGLRKVPSPLVTLTWFRKRWAIKGGHGSKAPRGRSLYLAKSVTTENGTALYPCAAQLDSLADTYTFHER